MDSDRINKSAVSPVLAVTLVIAVTIALSAVIGAFALDITESQNVTDINDKDIGVSISEKNGEVTIDIKTGTADAMRFIINGDEKKLFREASPGDSFSVYGIDADSDVTLIEIDGDSEYVIGTMNTVQDNEARSTILFDKNLYFESEALRIEVDDPSLSTDRDYIVNVGSDTENFVVTEEALPSGISTYTTNDTVLDRNNDAVLNKSDFDYTYSGFASNSIESVQVNPNNTVTVSFTGETDIIDDLKYDKGEVITLSHAGGSIFTGTIDVSQTDTKGVLNASDGDTITVRYKDPNTGEIREDTATFTP